MTADLQSNRSASLVAAPPGARRWLLFVHQLPAARSNLRVRTWRRLQQLGAIAVKQAVYVLPDTPGTREDFEWLMAEVKSAGGDATVFAADSVDSWSDDSIVEAFRRDRQESYAGLAGEVERVIERLSTTRRRRGTRAPATERRTEEFRQRLAALDQIDFFGSAGRDRAQRLLTTLEDQVRTPPAHATTRSPRIVDREQYQRRLWVTRPRPGVDRMASAWLIRRFIDGQARFGFAPDRERLPTNGAVPFDMFGVEFSHHDGGCTFETLRTVFGIVDPGVEHLAAIVHDLDLKDGRFGASDAPTIGHLIDGLQLAHHADTELLEHGMRLFDALYRAFTRSIDTSRRQPNSRVVPKAHAPRTISRSTRPSPTSERKRR